MHPLFQKDDPSTLKYIQRKAQEKVMNQDKMQGIIGSLQKYQTRQSKMEDILVTLEKEYDNLFIENQLLLDELSKRKKREIEIERFLSNIEDGSCCMLRKK